MPKYKNPPLAEALCEFQFDPGNQPADSTLPGLFYAQIREDFPKKKERIGFGLKINPAEGIIEPKFEMGDRIRFENKEENRLIQIGSNLIALNVLKPYPGWEEFKPFILENLERYKNLVGFQKFKRIGLRYINKIEIFNNSDVFTCDLNKYFNFLPSLPENLNDDFDAFNIKVEFSYGEDRLNLILANGPQERQNFFPFFLDIDYYLIVNNQVDEKMWLEKAHLKIEEIFEKMITDECRQLFEVIKCD